MLGGLVLKLAGMFIFAIPPGHAGNAANAGGNYWFAVIGRCSRGTVARGASALALSQSRARLVSGYVMILKGAIFVLVTMLGVFSQLMGSRTTPVRMSFITAANALGTGQEQRSSAVFVDVRS